MSTATTPDTWPELAEALYEKLTGRGSHISYKFEDMIIEVPRNTGTDVPRAVWRLHGTLTISTTERTA
jgi:hypothetical protein